MGNLESHVKLKELSLENDLSSIVHEDWNVCNGVYNNSKVTVFSALHPPSSRKRQYLEKALQSSKVYRHPGILKYIDGEATESEIVIVTEQATPLSSYDFEKLSLFEIISGLHSLTETIDFLHNKAGISHNNIKASSVYITKEGLWKLSGFEYSCSFSELNKDHIEKINQYQNEDQIPPDNLSKITPAYQHARDSFSYGKFIKNFIRPYVNEHEKDHLFEDFMKFICEENLHANFTKRPRFVEVLEQNLFKSEFLNLRNDLNNILLQPSDLRDEFLRILPSKLRNYSDSVIAATLSPFLLSDPFFLIPTSANYLMPHIITPKSENSSMGIFSESVFSAYIIPHVIRLFSSRDAIIRKILLSHFKHFYHLIPKNDAENLVLPELLLGIRDIDDHLIALTLPCLAQLISVLGADTVIGKNRTTIFSSGRPKNLDQIPAKNNESRPKVFPKIAENDCTCNEANLKPQDRSEPDGGEANCSDTLQINKKLSKKNEEIRASESISGPSESFSGTEELWSDWEEMLDQNAPDIVVGVLKVKEQDSVCETEDSAFCDNPADRNLKVENSAENNSQNHFRISFERNEKLMDKSNVKLTEDRISDDFNSYDVKNIEVNKKTDHELEFFADLRPNIANNQFNLETMLLEASERKKNSQVFHGGESIKKRSEDRKRISSLSDTLASLDIDQEGAYWSDC